MASSSSSEGSSLSGGFEDENSAAVTPPEEGEERRNWLELPREVTALILSRLFAVDILDSVQFVCKAWLEISNDPLVWKRIEMHKSGDDGYDDEFDLEKMFRCSVDRSCGQAVDIHMESFGSDEILKYMTDRLTRIKRLRLTYCDLISDKGLIETVAKLPSLEDLELSFCSFTAETLGAVGRHCPRLKSFKSNCRARRLTTIHFIEENEYSRGAIAIARSMPELSRLQLMGNHMAEIGLEAILDGCPKLESLDLRRCLNVSLVGSVWKRCTEQVKHLRHPDEPAKDYPFSTRPENEFSDSSDDDDYGDGDNPEQSDDCSSPIDFEYYRNNYYPSDEDFQRQFGHSDFSSGDDPFEYDDFSWSDYFWWF